MPTEPERIFGLQVLEQGADLLQKREKRPYHKRPAEGGQSERHKRGVADRQSIVLSRLLSARRIS
jgi:hypothetical protein